MKKSTHKRLTAWLLTLALVVTLLPGMGMTALAVEDGDEGNGPPAVEVVEPEDESSGSDETVGTPPQPEPEPPALPESKEEEKTTEDEGDPSGSDYDIEADTQPRGLMKALAAPTAEGELQVTGAYVGHDEASAQWVASYSPGSSITAIDPGSFYVEEQVYIKLVANSDHVKWTVEIGTLGSDATLDDTGLTLDENTGVISGTIAATRNGYLTLNAEDTQTGASLSFWLFTDFYSDSQKPVITTASLPNGTAEQEYSQRLEFTGYHSGWVEWTVVSGKLPDGLTVGYYSGGGGSLIRGTPTTAGTYTFTLKLRTVAGTTQKEFTLVINDALIAPVFKKPNSTIDLPYAVIGETYSYDMHEFLANGSTCSRPLTWRPSHLPVGLSFDTDTGVLSVAPTDSTPTALHYFTVQAQNKAGTSSQSFKIQVYRRPAITSTETALNLTAGVYFQWKPEYTGSGDWSATELPAGLKFSDGDGSIYGTPTVPGTYTVTLKLTTNSELFTEKNLKLVVAENNGINISQTSEHTFYGQQSGYAASALIAKEVTVTNTGYSDLPLTYKLTGINKDSFVLSKDSETLAPGASTTFTVKPKVGLPERTHKATVEVRSGNLVSAFNVSFTVSQNAVSPTVISTGEFPYAVVGKPWSYQLQASGTGPIIWAKDKENTNPWPAWLSLDPTTGVISGTPTGSAGHVSLNVKATNDAGPNVGYFYFQVYDKPTITLKVQNSSEEWVPHTSNTLPDAYTTQRGGYLQFYTGAGGGDTFTTIEGVMPSGMDFVDSDTWGQFIINNALSTGTYSFTLVSRNYVDSEKTQFIGEDRKTVTMTVYSEPQYNGTPGFSTGKMMVGTAITPIDFSELFSGGKAPFTYTVSGTLPQGLTLDTNTGILSGTPLTAGGSSSVRIYCKDVNGKSTDSPFSYGYRYLPQVALGTPDGASFLDSKGLDLKLDYPTLDGNVKLYYTTDGTDPEDSSTKKEAALGATVKIGANIGVGNSVTVRVLAYQSTAENGYQWSDETKATYVSVKRPLAPTANWEDGTTFTTPLGVMLSCDTVGATIVYKLNDSPTFKTYTGKPIVVTETTTLEVRSFLNSILSESVTYTYTKVAGVSVSGTAVSWNDKGNAEYYLYPTTMSDADIRAQWKKGGAVTGYTYTGTGGTISDVTVDGKAMKSQSFSFSTVPAGDYKLVIFKAEKYVPKIVPITVDSTDHDCGQLKLWLYGDVNYDGKVKAGDATQILKYTSYKRTFSEEEMLAADVNNDGKIKAGDATQILKYTSYKASAFDNIP